jgi:hypothetical protein
VSELRRIHAAYDDEGITVYQAYGPLIGEYALKHGRFGDGFKLDRMTWIKPSFGWMLYRCGYAGKPGQEYVLRIKLTHEGFRTILSRAVPSTYEPTLFADQADWQQAVKTADVRYQWDPDRTIQGGRMERRAIQLGLSGRTVHQYVNEWILSIEDATPLAKELGQRVGNKRSELPAVPDEIVYPVEDALQSQLMIGAQSHD